MNERQTMKRITITILLLVLAWPAGAQQTTTSAALDFTFERDPSATMTMIGTGVVVACTGGPDGVVQVAFPNLGVKKLALTHAKLDRA
jgi:hypothetical protein